MKASQISDSIAMYLMVMCPIIIICLLPLQGYALGGDPMGGALPIAAPAMANPDKASDAAFSTFIAGARLAGRDTPFLQEAQIRLSAVKESAIAYGMQGGLAFATREIATYLEENDASISQAFSFSSIMLPGPDSTLVIPPVIATGDDAWELKTQDENDQPARGKILRLSDGIYHIVSNAHFTSLAPQWRDYLLRHYKKPELPDMALLPHNEEEQTLWVDWTRQGWEKGQAQAHAIFKSDLRRLTRDLKGMYHYHMLVARNMISQPVLKKTSYGITGTKETLRMNDRIIKITNGSMFNHQSDDWVIVPVLNKTEGMR